MRALPFVIDAGEDEHGYATLNAAIAEADRLMADDPERWGNVTVRDYSSNRIWMCVLDRWTGYPRRLSGERVVSTASGEDTAKAIADDYAQREWRAGVAYTVRPAARTWEIVEVTR